MIDTVTQIRMLPLLERGRNRLAAYIESLMPEDRPIAGTSLAVVCREDFVQHTSLCLRHVEGNGVTLLILCENGDVCASISRLTWRRT